MRSNAEQQGSDGQLHFSHRRLVSCFALLSLSLLAMHMQQYNCDLQAQSYWVEVNSICSLHCMNLMRRV